MVFNILSVLTGDEPASELYPVPSDLPNMVEMDHDDGIFKSFDVETIEVLNVSQNGPRTIAKFADVPAKLYVSDRRTIIACSRYDKGGGFTGFNVGGLLVATAANAVSKSRAKKRREGKMLVGHVRHDWLAKVEAKNRQGIGTKNKLMLMSLDPTDLERLIVVNVFFPKELRATLVASEINDRANNFRRQLQSDGKSLISREILKGESESEVSQSGEVKYSWL